MASSRQIKTYLAHWFQLGKKLVWNNGKAELLPERIITSDRFLNGALRQRPEGTLHPKGAVSLMGETTGHINAWGDPRRQPLPNKGFSRMCALYRFSNEFEECWRKVMSIGGRGCYLEGTTVSIAELLDSSWTIDRCARCTMPVPILELGIQDLVCPCSDLDNWPNSELPAPRGSIDSRSQLHNISMRLRNIGVASKKDDKG